MRPYWLVVLAACGGGESPGIVIRNPSLTITDPAIAVNEASPQGARHVVFQVEVVSEICAPFDESFGGTFRGAPMTVLSPGTFGEQGDVGFCGNPTLIIDPIEVTSPVGNTIEVFDATGSVSATFEDGALEPRTIIATSFELVNNQLFTIGWSPVEDLVNPVPQLSFREVFEGPCMDGCLGAQTTTSGSLSDTTHVQFLPFVSSQVASGEIQVTMNFTESGSVFDCNARGCRFEFQHAAVHAASARP